MFPLHCCAHALCDAGISTDIARRLLSHIAWNNEPLASRIATVIQNGIVAADGDAIVPWFKAAAELFMIDDPLKDLRFQLLLTAITTAMQSQQGFYKATETALMQFLSLTKNNLKLRQWAYEHRQSLKWMVDWLRVNVRPPAYYQVRLCPHGLFVTLGPLLSGLMWF